MNQFTLERLPKIDTVALQDLLEIRVAGFGGVNAVAQEIVGIAATAIDGIVPAHRTFNHRHKGRRRYRSRARCQYLRKILPWTFTVLVALIAVLRIGAS